MTLIPALFTSPFANHDPTKFGPSKWNDLVALLERVLDDDADADGTIPVRDSGSITGLTWTVPPLGPAGPTGLTGPPGSIGLTGAIGPQGPIGLTGLQGIIGLTGAQGPIGVTGPAGAVGATGATGAAGSTGAAGATGATGTAGATGATGPAGPSVWGGITGSLSTQSDLQTALGLKLDTSALATWAGSTNLVTLGAAVATNLMLPAVTAGGVSGLFAGTRALVRLVQPALGAGGQAQGENLFSGGGNATLTNGAGTVDLASYNTAFGWDALLSLTTGSQNTAFGHRAGKARTTGNYNVAIGGGALLNNATNVGNVGVGTSALLTLTASGGDYNTGIGHDALEFLQTGTLNTSCGHRTNWQMTAGSSNTAIGAEAMFSNLTGGLNTALGGQALYSNLSGGTNVALGPSALFSNTTGSFCVAVGQAALLNLTADNYAIGIGTAAGRYLADGTTALLSAAQSVFLGGLTKSKQASQFNEIVIGYAAIGAGTRTAVIGASDVTDVYLGSASPAANLRAKAGFYTSAATVTRNALAATAADGFVLENTTAATAGAPVQNAPLLRLSGNVWNTTTPASNSSAWSLDTVLGSAAVPFSTVRFTHSLSGAAATTPLTIGNTGLVTIAGTAQTTLNIQQGEFKFYLGGGYFGMLAASQWNFSNVAGTVGFGFDGATNNVMKVRTRAQTGYATVDALGYSVSGAAGASKAAGPVTSITVVNGIVTAIS